MILKPLWIQYLFYKTEKHCNHNSLQCNPVRNYSPHRIKCSLIITRILNIKETRLQHLFLFILIINNTINIALIFVLHSHQHSKSNNSLYAPTICKIFKWLHQQLQQLIHPMMSQWNSTNSITPSKCLLTILTSLLNHWLSSSYSNITSSNSNSRKIIYHISRWPSSKLRTLIVYRLKLWWVIPTLYQKMM